MRKQGNSGGKVNNFGGDRIGHFEKKSLYEYVSNSELLARWSCLNLQTKNSTFNSKIDRKITHYDPTSPTEDNTGHLKYAELGGPTACITAHPPSRPMKTTPPTRKYLSTKKVKVSRDRPRWPKGFRVV